MIPVISNRRYLDSCANWHPARSATTGEGICRKGNCDSGKARGGRTSYRPTAEAGPGRGFPTTPTLSTGGLRVGDLRTGVLSRDGLRLYQKVGREVWSSRARYEPALPLRCVISSRFETTSRTKDHPLRPSLLDITGPSSAEVASCIDADRNLTHVRCDLIFAIHHQVTPLNLGALQIDDRRTACRSWGIRLGVGKGVDLGTKLMSKVQEFFGRLDARAISIPVPISLRIGVTEEPHDLPVPDGFDEVGNRRHRRLQGNGSLFLKDGRTAPIPAQYRR